LYLIAHAIAGTSNEGKNQIEEAVTEAESILLRQDSIQKLSSQIADKPAIFILGRGISYAAALEAALKIKEVSYIHAEGFAAGELKHGVIALIDKGLQSFYSIEMRRTKHIVSRSRSQGTRCICHRDFK
jgi:glucosamine--fructose-6-phosphate aminotransferase (isomerizing)